MDELENKKLEELLASGKKEEAKAYLNALLDKMMDEKFEGEALLDVSLAYMEVVNKIDEIYKRDLDEILAELKALKQDEKENEDKINLAKARISLN